MPDAKLLRSPFSFLEKLPRLRTHKKKLNKKGKKGKGVRNRIDKRKSP
jgi:hypothetical protein